MDAASRRERRLAVLESLGIRGAVADEIVASDPLPYTRPATAPALDLPLPDEPLAACWAQWADDARHDGVFETLRRHLVQLRFPVRAGISETDAYRAATRRGRFEEADAFAPGLELARPDALELDIVETMGGRLPVIVAGDRRDFVALVQALTTRNEPEPVPDSMGACFVKGLNNWSRVALYRDAWTKQTGGTDAVAWAEEFSRLVPQRELYQDRLIILSRGSYSAVPAATLGLDDDEWLARSIAIRREHELTHYFTYRVFGTMRSHVVDELIADLIGLLRGSGEYRAAVALRFLGLEEHPHYRTGGRLENYRGDLSDAAFAAIRDLVVRAAQNLERLALERRAAAAELHSLAELTLALAALSVEELASDQMPDFVREAV